MSAHAHAGHAPHAAQSPNRVAALATLHCLTGCAIGEVLGLVLGTALGLSNPATIALAIVLAFVFGYSLTMAPLLRSGLALSAVLPIAFAADTFSIAVMETVDNAVMIAVPGAMDASLGNGLFWGALALALAVAFVVAFPVNRWLIARGRGHAVVHGLHDGSSTPGTGAPDRGSMLRLALFGLGALAATIAIAVGGALLVERGHDDAPPPAAPGSPADPGHGAPAPHAG